MPPKTNRRRLPHAGRRKPVVALKYRRGMGTDPAMRIFTGEIYDWDEEDEEWDEECLTAYDPLIGPDPREWLGMKENTRIDLVLSYHRHANIALPNERIHAAIHAVIENQIALGDEVPVAKTLDRLVEEGLDRHEAVHAIGTVLSDFLYDVMTTTKSKAKANHNKAYFNAIEKLTAEKWRTGG